MFTAKTQSRIHSSMSAIGIPLVIPMLRRIQKAACLWELRQTKRSETKESQPTKRSIKYTHSSKAHLAKLPIGAVIEFSRNGKTVRLEKHEAAYQFKKPFWWNGSNYYPKKYIPRTYNIIKEAV